MNWPKDLSKKIKTNVSLADFTSFKIGGRAKFFFEPADLASLKQVLALAKKSGIKVFILGSGSNLLVNDSGVNGMVIKLTAKDFTGIYTQANGLTAGAGLKLSQLILSAKAKGLSGLEFLAGIPGTLGGSLAGNAGAWGHSVGERVKEVQVLDYQGKLKIIGQKKLKFSYRKSSLNKYVIISATLKLKAANKNLISLKIKEYLLKRNKAQGDRLANAGCIFKNPDKLSAGALIDRCGLKGKSRGGASVSKRHANFILNSNNAKAADVLSLVHLIQSKVESKFKIKLIPEIKIWK